MSRPTALCNDSQALGAPVPSSTPGASIALVLLLTEAAQHEDSPASGKDLASVWIPSSGHWALALGSGLQPHPSQDQLSGQVSH